MTGITPSMMLEQYRANADPFTRQQAELFRAMGPLDQRELLFWMVMHTALTMSAAMFRGPVASPDLDQAITDEINNPPKDIMS